MNTLTYASPFLIRIIENKYTTPKTSITPYQTSKKLKLRCIYYTSIWFTIVMHSELLMVVNTVLYQLVYGVGRTWILKFSRCFLYEKHCLLVCSFSLKLYYWYPSTIVVVKSIVSNISYINDIISSFEIPETWTDIADIDGRYWWYWYWRPLVYSDTNAEILNMVKRVLSTVVYTFLGVFFIWDWGMHF